MTSAATHLDLSQLPFRRRPPGSEGLELDPLLLAPVAPHDAYPFETLSRTYNYGKTSQRKRVFARLLIDEIRTRPGVRDGQAPVRVLDIGAGGGISAEPRLQRLVSAHADEMWGTEWDPRNVPAPGVFDRHLFGDVADLDLPDSAFDLAYSFLVMEHASDPERLLRAVHRALKPGGVYVFLTYNGRHPFTRIATALRRLHLEEIVLRIISKPGDLRWHYPVEYRFQFEGQITACADRIGFSPPSFVYLENGDVDNAFRGVRRPLLHLIRRHRRRNSNPKDLVTMIGRLRKPA